MLSALLHPQSTSLLDFHLGKGSFGIYQRLVGLERYESTISEGHIMVNTFQLAASYRQTQQHGGDVIGCYSIPLYYRFFPTIAHKSPYHVKKTSIHSEINNPKINNQSQLFSSPCAALFCSLSQSGHFVKGL